MAILSRERQKPWGTHGLLQVRAAKLDGRFGEQAAPLGTGADCSWRRGG